MEYWLKYDMAIEFTPIETSAAQAPSDTQRSSDRPGLSSHNQENEFTITHLKTDREE
jgi:hypothetical protein